VWLTQGDIDILELTAHRLTQPEDVLSSCHFVSEVLAVDFPPQTFLQYPNIVEGLFSLLAQRAPPPGQDAATLRCLHALVRAFSRMVLRAGVPDAAHSPLPMEETVLSFVHALYARALACARARPTQLPQALAILIDAVPILLRPHWTRSQQQSTLVTIIDLLTQALGECLTSDRRATGRDNRHRGDRRPGQGSEELHDFSGMSPTAAPALAELLRLLVPALLGGDQTYAYTRVHCVAGAQDGFDADAASLAAASQATAGGRSAVPLVADVLLPSPSSVRVLHRFVADPIVRHVLPALCRATSSLLQQADPHFGEVEAALQRADKAVTAAIYLGGGKDVLDSGSEGSGREGAQAHDPAKDGVAADMARALVVAAELSTATLEQLALHGVPRLASARATRMALRWMLHPVERVRAAFVAGAIAGLQAASRLRAATAEPYEAPSEVSSWGRKQ
jgi:hypothetical protein